MRDREGFLKAVFIVKEDLLRDLDLYDRNRRESEEARLKISYLDSILKVALNMYNEKDIYHAMKFLIDYNDMNYYNVIDLLELIDDFELKRHYIHSGSFYIVKPNNLKVMIEYYDMYSKGRYNDDNFIKKGIDRLLGEIVALKLQINN